MTLLQIVTLVLVLIAGTAVVLTPLPVRQTLVLALYGFGLTVLFFSFQAPDVALSEIVVSGVALPLIILCALRRLADERADHDRRQRTRPDRGDGGDP